MAAKKEELISVPTILHVLVVGFHHQKGSTVEFSYPPFCDTESLEEAQSITNFLPPVWKYLPYLALPDGCHNYEEDSVYFNLPSGSLSFQRDPVFGVACCRQVEVKDLTTVGKDVTRSSVQKSVCVLSRYPVFGYIEAKLNLATHAYFNIKDFSDTTILLEAYDNLNATFSAKSVKEMVHVGLSPKNLISRFHHRALQIFKALLLQKRVVVYDSPAKNVCSIVLSIASLFPNSLESLSLAADQYLDEHGFPLAIFPNNASLQPYLCLQQMELLASESSPFLLTGVVNPLFEKQHDKFCDVFLNVSDGLLKVHDTDLKSCLHLTSADLRFCSLLVESIQESTQQEMDTAHYSDWLGSDEWVRTQFKLYLISLLATSAREDEVSLSDFNSEFIASWLNGPVYSSWKSCYEKYEGTLKKFECAHVCASKSGLSLGDLKRRIIAQASDYGLAVHSKERATEETQRIASQTASRVSTAVGNMWTSASSTLSSWWTGNKDVKN